MLVTGAGEILGREGVRAGTPARRRRRGARRCRARGSTMPSRQMTTAAAAAGRRRRRPRDGAATGERACGDAAAAKVLFGLPPSAGRRASCRAAAMSRGRVNHRLGADAEYLRSRRRRVPRSMNVRGAPSSWPADRWGAVSEVGARTRRRRQAAPRRAPRAIAYRLRPVEVGGARRRTASAMRRRSWRPTRGGNAMRAAAGRGSIGTAQNPRTSRGRRAAPRGGARLRPSPGRRDPARRRRRAAKRSPRASRRRGAARAAPTTARAPVARHRRRLLCRPMARALLARFSAAAQSSRPLAAASPPSTARTHKRRRSRALRAADGALATAPRRAPRVKRRRAALAATAACLVEGTRRPRASARRRARRHGSRPSSTAAISAGNAVARRAAAREDVARCALAPERRRAASSRRARARPGRRRKRRASVAERGRRRVVDPLRARRAVQSPRRGCRAGSASPAPYFHRRDECRADACHRPQPRVRRAPIRPDGRAQTTRARASQRREDSCSARRTAYVLITRCVIVRAAVRVAPRRAAGTRVSGASSPAAPTSALPAASTRPNVPPRPFRSPWRGRRDCGD